MQVHLRASALGGYVTTLDADGTLSLARAGVPLGVVVLPPEALAGPWQTLRVSVIGGAVRVSVDDVPWLALLDPLPPGSIALRADVPQPLLVDDFTLAVPGFAPSATPGPTATPVILLDPPSVAPLAREGALSTQDTLEVRVRTAVNWPELVAIFAEISTPQAAGSTYVVILTGRLYTFDRSLIVPAQGQVYVVGNDRQNYPDVEASLPSYDPATDPRPRLKGTAPTPSRFNMFTVQRDAHLVLINLIVQDSHTTTQFIDQRDWNASGGAIVADDRSFVGAYRVLFSNNRVGNANAINSQRGTVQVHGSEFIGNSAVPSGGAGTMWSRDTQLINVACSTFKSNTSGYGPALANYPFITRAGMRVTHSNFITNTAISGQTATAQNIWNGLDPLVAVDAQQNYWQPGPGGTNFGTVDTSNPRASQVAIHTDPACSTAPGWATVPPVRNWNNVIIDPNATMPLIFEYRPCVVGSTEPLDRQVCGVHAFSQYRLQLGGDMTWGQLAALVAFREGNTLLGGQPDGSLANPQASGLGTCWRRLGNNPPYTYVSGESECNLVLPGSNNPVGIQNDFIYAIWEQMFNYCARGSGFTNYYRNGVEYRGECSEAGMRAWFSELQAIYGDNSFVAEPNKYLARMTSEFPRWTHGRGAVRPPRYTYGRCPCGWENVRLESQARTGISGRTWAYSYLDNGTPGRFRYFRVYGEVE